MSLKTNGEEERCFCYIDDCIDAMLLCVENSKTKKNIPYNISSGYPVKIKSIAKQIIEISGKEIDLKLSKKVAGLKEQNILYEKINKELGWAPKVQMREGLERTYRDIERRIEK